MIAPLEQPADGPADNHQPRCFIRFPTPGPKSTHLQLGFHCRKRSGSIRAITTMFAASLRTEQGPKQPQFQGRANSCDGRICRVPLLQGSIYPTGADLFPFLQSTPHTERQIPAPCSLSCSCVS